jgi:hypothetical protein
MMKGVSNELKSWGVFIEWCGTKFEIFRKKFGFFGAVKNANFSV